MVPSGTGGTNGTGTEYRLRKNKLVRYQVSVPSISKNDWKGTKSASDSLALRETTMPVPIIFMQLRLGVVNHLAR